MIAIKYFLPDNVYNNNEINIPNKPYNLTLDENMLSKISLQINDSNLCDLISKQDDKSTNQSDTTLNDEDTNLKIEEKFAKYCTVNALSTVTFGNNQNNNIQNTFAIKYSNCNHTDEIITNQKEAELKDVSPSTSFLNTAIEAYKKVADFVDTQEIANAADSSKKLSSTLKIEIGIMVVEIIIILVAIIVAYFISSSPHLIVAINEGGITSKNALNKKISSKKLYLIKVTMFLVIPAIILYMIWYFGVARPISSQAEKIKNWNNAITTKTKYSNIRVLNKIAGDKDHFKSCDVLNKSFTINPAKTFASCFYYFHFNNFLLNEDKNADNINKQIKDDYDQFNETKKDYDVTIDKDCFKWILVIILALVLIGLLIWICQIFEWFWTIIQKLWDVKKRIDDEGGTFYGYINGYLSKLPQSDDDTIHWEEL